MFNKIMSGVSVAMCSILVHIRSVHGFVHTRHSPMSSTFSTLIKASQSEVNHEFRPVLVSIEGNIGAGKTTILSNLKQRHPEWTYIDEPVNIWTSLKTDDGLSLLEAFYKDRKRWSYTFQNCALLTRYQMIEESVNRVRTVDKLKVYPNHIFLTERCLDTDHMVFTKMLRDEGSIDGMELKLYEKLLFHLQKSATPVSAIVHVDTNPVLCAERIKIRSRNGEENIPLSYLQLLDKYQSQWVDNAGVPMIKTGGDGIDKVESFILSLQNRNFTENK